MKNLLFCTVLFLALLTVSCNQSKGDSANSNAVTSKSDGDSKAAPAKSDLQIEQLIIGKWKGGKVSFVNKPNLTTKEQVDLAQLTVVFSKINFEFFKDKTYEITFEKDNGVNKSFNGSYSLINDGKYLLISKPDVEDEASVNLAKGFSKTEIMDVSDNMLTLRIKDDKSNEAMDLGYSKLIQ